MTWSDYKSHVRALLTQLGRQKIIVGDPCLSFKDSPFLPKNTGGSVFLKPGLRFSDGAWLRVLEEIRIENDLVLRDSYCYHYERSEGYFFRYEREPTDDLTWKPEYHMHVCLDLPHFDAPDMTLERVIELIVINFYTPPVAKRGKLIGRRLALTV